MTRRADLDFSEAFKRLGLRVHLGLYQDETAKYCHWHINGTHYLEQWGDTPLLSTDGEPHPAADRAALQRTSESELIEFLSNEDEASSYELTSDTGRHSIRARISRVWWERRCTTDSWPARRLRPSR